MRPLLLYRKAPTHHGIVDFLDLTTRSRQRLVVTDAAAAAKFESER